MLTLKSGILSLVFTMGISLLVPAAKAQNPSDSLVPTDIQLRDMQLREKELIPNWTLEEWSGNDAHYKIIEANIDSQIAQRQLTSEALKHYKVRAEAKPPNPEDIFRWVYASYKAERVVPPIAQTNSPGSGIMSQAQPHSYEFTRLHFLLQTDEGGYPIFRSVGERLIKRNPKDYVVKYFLITCIDPTISDRAKQDALSYARALIKEQPNRPSAYLALGSIYYILWSVNKRDEDGKYAVSAYSKYLHLAPLNARGRAQSVQIIKTIQDTEK